MIKVAERGTAAKPTAAQDSGFSFAGNAGTVVPARIGAASMTAGSPAMRGVGGGVCLRLALPARPTSLARNDVQKIPHVAQGLLTDAIDSQQVVRSRERPVANTV